MKDKPQPPLLLCCLTLRPGVGQSSAIQVVAAARPTPIQKTGRHLSASQRLCRPSAQYRWAFVRLPMVVDPHPICIDCSCRNHSLSYRYIITVPFLKRHFHVSRFNAVTKLVCTICVS